MKIIVTTSDNYHHLIPIFLHLFQKNWGGPIELVGYKKPPNLPDWVTFVSLGKQRGPQYFSTDKREYFAKQDQYFIWLMEDYFIKSVDFDSLHHIIDVIENSNTTFISKYCLTNESMRRKYSIIGNVTFSVDQNADYRLSCQPAIWNRDYLVKNMPPGLTPWQWETQNPKNDWAYIIGSIKNIIEHNEGTTKHNIKHLNLNGFDQETINELKPWLSDLTY